MLPRIRLDCVNVRLAGRRVLHDINWSLEPGRHWAFVGPNGSGKSTLLRTIAGLQWIEADGGTRCYSPDGVRVDAVARAIGWIRLVSAEQHERYARLDLGLTGRSVIESGITGSVYVQRAPGPAPSGRVDALIAELDLHDIAVRPIRELSTGQLRRVLIARALVAEPRVIVLDEYAGGLDRRAHSEVITLLDRIAPRVTLVVASHRDDDFPAAITDTAGIRNGRITAVRAGRPDASRMQAAATSTSASAPSTPHDADVLLRFRHADVYRGTTRVLENVDWELRRGEHTLIRGANGAGKSTFAGLIAGTIPAATGAFIERFGEHGPFDVWRLKERVAHLSDDLQIAYDRSDPVADVVASGFAASIGLFGVPARAQWAAVDAVIARLGLEALRDRAFGELSFGERRKVLIARSIVRRPEIFILDEIWNGLDRDFRRSLSELTAEMAAAGTTIVAIAHEEDDDIRALVCRVCTISNARVAVEAAAPVG